MNASCPEPRQTFPTRVTLPNLPEPVYAKGTYVEVCTYKQYGDPCHLKKKKAGGVGEGQRSLP